MRVNAATAGLGVLLYLLLGLAPAKPFWPAVMFFVIPLPLLIVLSTTYWPRKVAQDEKSSFGPGWPFIFAAVGIPFFAAIIEFYVYVVVLAFSTAAISIHWRERRNVPAPARSWHLAWASLVLLPVGFFAVFWIMLRSG